MAAAILLAGGGAYLVHWAQREDLEHDGFAWVWRSRLYPVKGDGCALLDATLGSSARDPRALLETFGWQYHEESSRNPHSLGFPGFFDVQHQALVRLLAMQQEKFGTRLPPASGDGLRADHTGAVRVGFSGADQIIKGSASVFPDSFDQHPWEGYYQWELFRFAENGQLLERKPYGGR